MLFANPNHSASAWRPLRNGQESSGDDDDDDDDDDDEEHDEDMNDEEQDENCDPSQSTDKEGDDQESHIDHMKAAHTKDAEVLSRQIGLETTPDNQNELEGLESVETLSAGAHRDVALSTT